MATVVEDVGVMPRAFCGAELQKGAQFGLQGVQAETCGVVTSKGLDEVVGEESLHSVQSSCRVQFLGLPWRQQQWLSIRTASHREKEDKMIGEM